MPKAAGVLDLCRVSLAGGTLCVKPCQRRGTLLLLQGIRTAPQLRPQVVHRPRCGIQLLQTVLRYECAAAAIVVVARQAAACKQCFAACQQLGC
jgi:hypothetical protein